METTNTASAIISFATRLEDSSAVFYRALAERWPEHAATFRAHAQDDEKNRLQIVRTYQETITDALEACFSFEGLNLADYTIDATLPDGATLPDALRQALALEETTIAFYEHVAERSASLLATIPGAFRRVARRRSRRIVPLQGFLAAA